MLFTPKGCTQHTCTVQGNGWGFTLEPANSNDMQCKEGPAALGGRSYCAYAVPYCATDPNCDALVADSVSNGDYLTICERWTELTPTLGVHILHHLPKFKYRKQCTDAKGTFWYTDRDTHWSQN